MIRRCSKYSVFQKLDIEIGIILSYYGWGCRMYWKDAKWATLPGNIGGGRLCSCHSWQGRGEVSPKRFRHPRPPDRIPCITPDKVGGRKTHQGSRWYCHREEFCLPSGLIFKQPKCLQLVTTYWNFGSAAACCPKVLVGVPHGGKFCSCM